MFDLIGRLFNRDYLDFVFEGFKWFLIVINYSVIMYFDFFMNIWFKWEFVKIICGVLEGIILSV